MRKKAFRIDIIISRDFFSFLAINLKMTSSPLFNGWIRFFGYCFNEKLSKLRNPDVRNDHKSLG